MYLDSLAFYAHHVLSLSASWLHHHLDVTHCLKILKQFSARADKDYSAILPEFLTIFLPKLLFFQPAMYMMGLLGFLVSKDLDVNIQQLSFTTSSAVYSTVRCNIPLDTLQVISETILQVSWPNEQCHRTERQWLVNQFKDNPTRLSSLKGKDKNARKNWNIYIAPRRPKTQKQ